MDKGLLIFYFFDCYYVNQIKSDPQFFVAFFWNQGTLKCGKMQKKVMKCACVLRFFVGIYFSLYRVSHLKRAIFSESTELV